MATQIFFKFEGPAITGSSLMKGHEGMQEIISYSHSWEQPTNPVRSEGTGDSKELTQHGNLQLTMSADVALTAMLGHLWSGKHIDKGTLTCYRVSSEGVRDAVPYLKVELEAVVITHMEVAGDGGASPLVSAALNYQKVTYTYQSTDPSKVKPGSTLPKSHDLRTNVVA